MSILASIFERRSSDAGDRGWHGLGSGSDLSTKAGVKVGPDSVMSFSAVYACVRNLSEDLGKLPFILYQQTADGRERAVNDPLYTLLRTTPNPEMTAMNFRQTITAHAMLWRGGYAWIERDQVGRPIALWPLHPGRVSPKRTKTKEKRLYWEVRSEAGKPWTFEDDDMFHIEGLGFEGIIGYSVASRAKESLGIYGAVEQFAATFFGNGSTVSGVLEHPGKLSAEARTLMRGGWEDIHQGSNNAHRVAILQEGTKYAKIGIAPEEAQFLESRQFQIEEVCRWLRVPPHKIQHLARATFSNIEHQGIEYVVDSLGAWFVRWEQETTRKLIMTEGQYAEHLADALLRGDNKSRFEAYGLALSQGWMTRDEIRARENLNPYPDGMGKVPLVPVNMASLANVIAGKVDPAAASDPAKDPAPTPAPAPTRALVRVFEDVAARMIRKESQAARRAAKKPAEFSAWMTEFYADHQVNTRDAFGPAFDSLGELRDGPNFNRQTTATATAAAAEAHCKESRLQLTAALVLPGGSVDLEKRVNGLCDSWERSRPAEFANKVLEIQP